MNYRYYYNSQGTILGFTEYRTICYTTAVGDSTGHIDSTDKVVIEDYTVDLTTKTLVARNQ